MEIQKILLFKIFDFGHCVVSGRHCDPPNVQLDLFFGLPQLFASFFLVTVFKNDCGQKNPKSNSARDKKSLIKKTAAKKNIFWPQSFLKRCHFVSCTAWVGFFWPQSFLKGAMLYLALLGSDFFGHSHF